jgi:phosphomethylpyrimidine synthase
MGQAFSTIARREGVPVSHIKEGVQNGHIVLVKNRRHRIKPLAIGEGLTTKVNANIGTSPDLSNLKTELKKLSAAVNAGADTVMDLSTGGNIDRIRKEIVQAAGIPVGTVPIYQVAILASKKGRPFVEASVDEMFDVIQQHLEDGVDFITVHCGVTRSSIRGMRRKKRTCGVVSRGGSMMIEWMAHNRRENPLY